MKTLALGATVTDLSIVGVGTLRKIESFQEGDN